jgi:tRNA (cmo5U34)-methyltransferase
MHTSKIPITAWTGTRVTDYAHNQRIHLPHKREMLCAVAGCLPFPRNFTGRILDIGAGQGALSTVLLRRFPRAQLTLLDSSAEMLAIARQDLAAHADRVDIILADFTRSGWHKSLAPPFDAIVSSLALHYLPAPKRPAFFSRVHDLLVPGGWFIDADLFDCECATIAKHIEALSAGHACRQLAKITGEKISPEEMIMRRGNATTHFRQHRSTIAAETAQLTDAGFAAGCIWQYWHVAILAAIKN